MPVGYEVMDDQGQRAWWDGKKIIPLDANGLQVNAGGPKLTEDQGKTSGWGRSMANAEEAYAHAREDGYNPASLRNTLASFAEGLPKGIGEGIAAGIRDDVSDKGHQAELQWTDAQLRAQSGANAPDPEVKKYVRTYFPGVGEDATKIGGQKEQARVTAFDSAKIRAGPAAAGVRGYGQGKEKPEGWTKTLPPAQLQAAMAFKGSRRPAGTAANPSVPADEAEYAALPPKTYFIHPDGSIRRKP